MARGNGHMPPLDAVWIALAIVIWATATALGDKRRERFIDAVDAITSDHDARRRVVALATQNGRRNEAQRHVQVAVSFLSRIVGMLRGAFK